VEFDVSYKKTANCCWRAYDRTEKKFAGICWESGFNLIEVCVWFVLVSVGDIAHRGNGRVEQRPNGEKPSSALT